MNKKLICQLCGKPIPHYSDLVCKECCKQMKITYHEDTPYSYAKLVRDHDILLKCVQWYAYESMLPIRALDALEKVK